MSFYSEFIRIRCILDQHRANSVIPSNDDQIRSKFDNFDFDEYKRKSSMAHIRQIRRPETFGILVVNLPKHGIRDYIGPNTFAEVAVAFSRSKRIYLAYDIPEFYIDELRAWQVIPLAGDLSQLITDYESARHCASEQLELF
jgi:hypothetical protein